MAIGLASNLSPMYIAEIAPSGIRGQLVSLNQLTIVIGVLAAQVMNWLIARPVAARHERRRSSEFLEWTVGLALDVWSDGRAFAVFLVVVLTVPESPRWLAKNGQSGRARADLSAWAGLCSHHGNSRISNRPWLTTSREWISGSCSNRKWSASSARHLPGGVPAVVRNQCRVQLCAGGFLGGWLSGLRHPVQHRGYGRGIVHFHLHRHQDRRPTGAQAVDVGGSAGLAIIYLLLGPTYHLKLGGWPVLALVVFAVGCYSFSLAPIIWVILSEIFPNRIRGAAMAVAVFSLWTGCFVLTYSFRS